MSMDPLTDARNLVVNVRDFGAWDAEPASERTAHEELAELRDALVLIAAQHAEQQLRLGPAEFVAWRARAARAQAIFGRRRRFLGRWIATRGDTTGEAERAATRRKQRVTRTNEALEAVAAFAPSAALTMLGKRVWALEVVFAHAWRLVEDFSDDRWSEFVAVVDEAADLLGADPAPPEAVS